MVTSGQSADARLPHRDVSDESMAGMLLPESALSPETFAPLAPFPMSLAVNLPKSPGEPVNASTPMSASRVFILGSATPALISLLSLSTISFGVFLGAATPDQPLDS